MRAESLLAFLLLAASVWGCASQPEIGSLSWWHDRQTWTLPTAAR